MALNECGGADEESLYLDFTIESPQERTALVEKIVNKLPLEQLTPRYLDYLSDYIIFAMTKQEKKEKKILTDNRMVTVNKRETSYEGLCSKFENGEDGIYHLMSDLGKGTILTPKDGITEEDIQQSEDLKTLREEIAKIEEEYKKAYGKRKHLLKKQLIEMRQDQYVIRNEMRGQQWGGNKSNFSVKVISKLNLYDSYSIDENGEPHNNGIIDLFNPEHVEAILCNYSALKEHSYGQFDHDLWFLMQDIDALVEETLRAEYPLYYDILIYKIDGDTNLEIQRKLENEYNIVHTVEYISSLWRNKIPKLIAKKAKENYLIWHYTIEEKGQWKKCTRCGQIKLAHNMFFSKNKSSKDGWYSLCKDCRNANSKKSKKKAEAKQIYIKAKGK